MEYCLMKYELDSPRRVKKKEKVDINSHIVKKPIVTSYTCPDCEYTGQRSEFDSKVCPVCLDDFFSKHVPSLIKDVE